LCISAEAVEKQKSSLAKRASGLLGKVFGQSDTILDSLLFVVPFAHPIKEFKETFERFSYLVFVNAECYQKAPSNPSTSIRQGASPGALAVR
jgi:hypothetical protein